jgi:hypothetical protein
MPWSRAFEDPVPLPHGLQFVTLKDAGTYITKVPKAVHEAPGMAAVTSNLISETRAPIITTV